MRSLLPLALVVSLLAAPATSALAAPEKKSPEVAQTEARARGEEGLAAFEAGKWDEAYRAFQDADGLYHAPTLVLFMARCRRNQGKLVEAKGIYERVTAEPVPKNAPEQFSKAVATARDELQTLVPRIPVVRVSLPAGAARDAQVKIDGAQLSLEEQASGRGVDPGSHEITATSRDGASVSKTLSLKEQESVTVALPLRVAPAAAGFRVSWPAERWPAVVAGGVGVAGVGVGAVTGIVALSKSAYIKSRCSADGHCYAVDQPEADRARALGVASAVGFAIGAVGLGAGAALWFLRPGLAKAPARSSTHLELGLGSLSIGGSF